MILKNGELYQLNPKDLETVKKHFGGRMPKAVVYPPERIIPSRSKDNLKPDKPNSISFPLTSVVMTATGSDVWTYAEHIINLPHGVKKYTPKNFRYQGNVNVEKNPELIWFLFAKSEYCKGGLNQGSTVKFMFDDPYTVADKRAELEALTTDVHALIWSKTMGLSEEKLRKIAGAYFIKNVEKLNFSQVKAAVDGAVKREQNGLQKFKEMIDLDGYVDSRNRLAKLIDAGNLKFDVAKRRWVWQGENDRTEMICSVPAGSNANDALYDFFKGNEKFHSEVEQVELAMIAARKDDQ